MDAAPSPGVGTVLMSLRDAMRVGADARCRRPGSVCARSASASSVFRCDRLGWILSESEPT